MNPRACLRTLAAVVGIVAMSSALAQVPPPQIVPSVSVSASATATVTNDRLQAWLRTEAENVSPAAAAAQVNAASAKAIADAKAFPGVKVQTMGYSTQQIAEKGRPTRWRVSQTIAVDATDFAAAATLLSKLQDENGLLLSNMSLTITDKARRDAEDSVTQQAIKAWQVRAEQAAKGLGFAMWHVGHVTVQTSGGQPYPVMRVQAMAMTAGAAPPVAVEAGTTDVTVSVSGDALLDKPR